MTTTATRFEPVTLDTPEYAIKLTREQFQKFIGCELQDTRGQLKTFGPWSLPVTFKAPCIKRHWKNEGYGNNIVAVTFYGRRSLYRMQQAGYWLEGKCKVEGKEVSGDTCDIMVEVEGNLYDIAVIAIRG